MVCEETYLFPMNINYQYYVLQKIKFIDTIVSIGTMINDSFKVMCYN